MEYAIFGLSSVVAYYPIYLLNKIKKINKPENVIYVNNLPNYATDYITFYNETDPFNFPVTSNDYKNPTGSFDFPMHDITTDQSVDDQSVNDQSMGDQLSTDLQSDIYSMTGTSSFSVDKYRSKFDSFRSDF